MPETVKKGAKSPAKPLKAATKVSGAMTPEKRAEAPKPTPRRVFDQKVADIICIMLSEGLSL